MLLKNHPQFHLLKKIVVYYSCIEKKIAREYLGKPRARVAIEDIPEVFDSLLKNADALEEQRLLFGTILVHLWKRSQDLKEESLDEDILEKLEQTSLSEELINNIANLLGAQTSILRYEELQEELQDEFIQLIGERICELRKVNNYTIDELSSILGVSKTTLHSIERGKQEIPLTVLHRISMAFQIPLPFLVYQNTSTSTQSPQSISQLTEEQLKAFQELDLQYLQTNNIKKKQKIISKAQKILYPNTSKDYTLPLALLGLKLTDVSSSLRSPLLMIASGVMFQSTLKGNNSYNSFENTVKRLISLSS